MIAKSVMPKKIDISVSNSAYAPAKQLGDLLAASEDYRAQQVENESVESYAAGVLFVTLADFPNVAKLTRSFCDRYPLAERLIWVAPAFDEHSEIGRMLAESEAIVTSCKQKSLIVHHAPLIDELLRNNKEIKFRRTLSLPLSDYALPWLSSEDLTDAIYKWLQSDRSDSQAITITGATQLTGADLAQEISQALERNLDSRKYALRRFKAIDTDSSGQLDSEEMFAYLLELGYGSEEAQTIVDEADTNKDGELDFEEFIEGIGEHLEHILTDVPAQVQYINVPRSTALYDLVTKGMAEKTAHSWLDWLDAIQEFGMPTTDYSQWLGRQSTSITDWLEQHVLDFINVYILPGRGVLTISEGTLEGKPALTTRLLQGDDLLLQGTRTLDNKAVEWQVVGEDSDDVEVVRHELSKGGVRVLKLKDGQLVSLSVRGLWTGRRWATELFFKHQPLPRWQINLFRELGELQIEEASSLIEPEGVVCNCTQTTCGKLQELIEGGMDTLEQIADDTKATMICGGCQPLVEELLGSANLAVAELISKEDLGQGIFRFQLRPVGESVATSKPG